MSAPRPLYFYDASDLPLLLERSRAVSRISAAPKETATSETLFTNRKIKRKKNILQMYNAREFFFFTKKTCGSFNDIGKNIDAVRYIVRYVHDIKKESSIFSFLYLLWNE